MAKIQINNPRQIINGGAKKYYFKVKGLGGPKGDKGDKGDKGSRGPQGEPGNAATVYVGSTTTLPVGQDATVENVGTQYNAVLNFGIPQGPRGPQGIQGERGEPGQTGQTGPRGPQGERGTNATVSIGTTYTLNPGSQATVYNSGSDSNAVLNFGIPRGDVGPQPELVQTTGTSTTKAMSQNATTVALAAKQNTIDSSHKLSADLVTDTTTTNKFVTAEDKTTWNAKQNALTAGQGIDITSDVISTPALVPEVVAELPTTGEEGKLYLTPKSHTTQTAAGNPITATVAEDVGALESFQLDGDTAQTTYTGKNMIGFPTGSKTVDGITCTIDDDGTITVDGTRETTGATWLNTSNLMNFKEGSITITVIPISGSFSGVNIGYRAFKSNQSAQAWYQVYMPNGNYGQGTITKTAEVIAEVGGINILIGSGTAVFDNFKFKMQVTAGSGHDTDYEPFVGGVPSPNPDYPQQIQTVTGEQTVTIEGKNKYPFNDTAWTSTATTTTWCYQDGSTGAYGATVTDSTNYKLTLPAGTYTVTGYNLSDNLVRAQVVSNGESGETIWANGIQSNQLAQSFTLTEATTLCVRYRVTNPSLGIGNTKIQIESGTTSTTYSSYSKQTLPIDLGSIELCKLSTYQDYIYKDGEDWKVHKATGSDSASNRTWIWANVSPNGWYYTTTLYGNYETNVVNVISEKIIGVPRYDAPSILSTFITMSYDGNIGIRNKDITGSANVSQFTDWLNSLNTTWRYALARPTDTTITDTNLIAQLEAIRTASLENGANTITNSAPAPNLAGDMEIGYYGYNPTNRYDKWLWLDLNNSYEQIGS